MEDFLLKVILEKSEIRFPQRWNTMQVSNYEEIMIVKK